MKLKGIRSVKPVEVNLEKFFDYRATVTVRPLPPPVRAQIQELTTNGMRYATTQGKKSLDINAIEQAMPAGVTMEVRDIKLAEGVISHTIVDEDGKPVAWDKETWDALDAADPAIIEKILTAVTEITYPDDEDGTDPSSPTQKKKK